jgi:hypothetical protein
MSFALAAMPPAGATWLGGSEPYSPGAPVSSGC